MAIGGTWPGNPTASTVFPATTLVDYVRVYQMTNGGGGSATPTLSPSVSRTSNPPTGQPAACSATYQVTNQWPGGFGANVTVRNEGASPLNGWTVTWTFADGQTISQLWGGSLTQSGSSMTVKNLSYNGAIGANGSTTFGFNASWNNTNGVPTLTCTSP